MASDVAERVIERLSEFPPEAQQQVLDFVELLSLKLREKPADDLSEPEPSDFYKERLSKYSGCVSGGPSDLSTNKDYMKDFGKV